MNRSFATIVAQILEDFNIFPQPKLPGTYSGKNLDWGKSAPPVTGFKGDVANPSNTQIVFTLPVKKKKKNKNKSFDILKKRVAAKRIGG
jgi:hypothetical protein